MGTRHDQSPKFHAEAGKKGVTIYRFVLRREGPGISSKDCADELNTVRAR
jgi:hypothetical protein